MTFIRYISSAGSGKTYALVKEYLKLVLKNKWNFSSVLAITFTNKAATEMKDRIVKALKELSINKNEDLEKNIKEETDLKDIDKKSADVLSGILHNYSDFSVMTIDSFFYKLLRSFSYEEDIPAGFDVELNLKNINETVIRKIYSEVGVENVLTEIVLKFVLSKVYSEKSFDIEKDLRIFEQEITSERKEANLENLKTIDINSISSSVSKLKSVFYEFIDEIDILCRRSMEIMKRNGLRPEDFAHKNSGAAAFLRKNVGIGPGMLKKFKLNKYFSKGKWIAGSTPDNIREKIEKALIDGLEEIRESFLSLYEKDFQKVLSAFLIFENIYLLGLTRHIDSFIEKYKRENNIIPINEFNRRIFSIIKSDDIPFIYAILGNRFSNILIDEFQDTSRMQWESIYPLIENSLSEGNLCLAVGDPKQSIYRWRGGDLEIITKDIPARIKEEQLETKSLKNNYRARENIVEFNNLLFSERLIDAGGNEMVKEIYSDAEQISSKGSGGYISVDFIEGKNSEVTDPLIYLRVKEIINELNSKGFNYSDIVILVRKNIEATKIAKYLMSENIPVISPDSLKLSSSPLTTFIINLLKLLFDPEDKMVLSEVLFFMKYNFKISLKMKEIEAYLQKNSAKMLPDSLMELINKREFLMRLPIFETIERIIRIFKLNESLKFIPSGFIATFRDMIIEYSRIEGSDILSFFNWWEINGDEFLIPGSGSSNGVNLMTVHKAKGLQFLSVIIPYADWQYRSDGNIWLEGDENKLKEIGVNSPCYVKSSKVVAKSLFGKSYSEELKRVELDNVNLLYVACTRAIDSLHIISGFPANSGKLSNSFLLLNLIRNGNLVSEEIPEKRYIYGSLKKTPDTNEKREVPQIIDKIIFEPWSDRISIIRRAKEFSGIIPGEKRDKIRYGNLVHKLLSEISVNRDYERLISELIISGEISKIESDKIRQSVEKLLNDKNTSKWFFGKGEKLNEVTLINSDKMFRPDKIIIEDSNVTVVDFKTGSRRNSDIMQVSEYCEIILQMGYENVKGFLYYIAEEEIVKV